MNSSIRSAGLVKLGSFRRIVTLSRFDRVAGTPRQDLYLVVLSVFCGVGRQVTKAVLASQLFRNLVENLLKTVLIADNECRSAGFLGEFFQSADIAAAINSAAAATA